MIDRYKDQPLAQIWSEANKVHCWDLVEMAVIQARVQLKEISRRVCDRICRILVSKPVNLKTWKRLEDKLRHDLNAYAEERKRQLPPELRRHFHDVITSYDTEEPAFARMLNASIGVILERAGRLVKVISGLAVKYRYTIMNARTHGQEAELQSFGKRCLTWIAQLQIGIKQLQASEIKQSKLSGAIGNYGGLSPELERVALEILGLKPFFGATQIVPRELYAPVAQALCNLVGTMEKISLDFRLNAKSGLPLMQEPFGKLQTGSSAMPQKKNTISTEKISGMNRVAQGYSFVATANISTWEERAIEQSSAERIIWPGLFHIVAHVLETLTKVLSKANIYADNMLLEIVNSRGCYAAALAKDFLKEHGSRFGISADDAYRIVQLAAFNVFEPVGWARVARSAIPGNLTTTDLILEDALLRSRPEPPVSIREHIASGHLRVSEQLAPTKRKVTRWNLSLERLFANRRLKEEWLCIFKPSHILQHEAVLYREILDK